MSNEFRAGQLSTIAGERDAAKRALSDRDDVYSSRGIGVQKPPDSELLNRALGILHRLGTERTGWRSFFSRWYYSDEPLRNDAANLVRLAGFAMPMPNNTHLVGGSGPSVTSTTSNTPAD